VMYGNEKNSSPVFEIYECLFELKQGDKFVPAFYRELKSLIDELEMHQPVVVDAATLKGIVRISHIEVHVWLESYTTILGVGSDTGRR